MPKYLHWQILVNIQGGGNSNLTQTLPETSKRAVPKPSCDYDTNIQHGQEKHIYRTTSPRKIPETVLHRIQINGLKQDTKGVAAKLGLSQEYRLMCLQRVWCNWTH